MLTFAGVRTISSRQNALVRAFRELADDPSPSGARLLLDGVHLVSDARRADLPFEVVAVAESRLESDTEEARLARALDHDGIDVVVASGKVFEALSPVRTPSGIAAIASRRAPTAAEICAHPQAFVVAVADVQDPGNVGSLLRAAEAGGTTGALVCGGSANPFSWKALRGSMGSALRVPVAAGLSVTDAVQCMRKAGLHVVGAVARGGKDPDDILWRGRVGLLLGGEGAGLPDEIVEGCDSLVTIPMAPAVESLNVAAAAAILVYAARRQRI
jgi:TrmH family RNA methyltransferase